MHRAVPGRNFVIGRRRRGRRLFALHPAFFEFTDRLGVALAQVRAANLQEHIEALLHVAEQRIDWNAHSARISDWQRHERRLEDCFHVPGRRRRM